MIPLNPDLPDINSLHPLVKGLLALARVTRQRRVLVLAGDIAWCRHTAQAILAAVPCPRALWVSDIALPSAEVLSGAQVKTLLGQEREAVVFDAHAGFDADAFGAVGGIIPGGGLLLLLCPPLANWEQVPDPASERIAIWPYGIADVSRRFIRRLLHVLREPGLATIIEQGHEPPVLPAIAPSMTSADASRTEYAAPFANPEQRLAVEAIEQVLHGHRHRPLVLVADRGRGKSAALGIAAARLMLAADRPLRIVVTAPRPDAVHALFAQAQKLLPLAQHSSGYLEHHFSSLEFIAPDVLCLGNTDADLLLVDEAAAIPAGLLQQLLLRHPRLVFATTVHGYEGTGRGFAIRFRAALETQTPGWRELRLQAPIRWAAHDPLERLVFRALLLDAQPADDSALRVTSPRASHHALTLARLDREQLPEQEILLAQVFGLLVAAHYRTTPTDLRNLLDGPGIDVYVITDHGQVVAVALLVQEGGFDAPLAQDIYRGLRRPRGHLLAQSLLAHLGIRAAAPLRCARVMRIAVHPAAQRRGLGSRLLAYVREDMRARGVDLLGASFGATVDLLRFWQHSGMQPVRIGFHRDHASGEHSLLVLESLTASGEPVLRIARTRFARDLPHWLADPLRDLDPVLAQSLLASASGTGATAHDDRLTAEDQETLRIFAHGQRSYEDSLGPLWRLCSQDLEAAGSRFNERDKHLLLGKVLQHHSWSAVAEASGLSGRAEALAALRVAAGRLLDALMK